jgi:hypothetical protein
LLVGRWSYYATGTGVGADAHNWIRLRPAPQPGLPEDTLFEAALTHTLQQLDDLVPRVFVLRQVPEIADYDSGVAAQALAYGRKSEEDIRMGIARTARPDVEARASDADQALVQAAEQTGAEVIDLWSDLCDASHCAGYLGETPIYFDNNHVTNTGAIGLRQRFRPVFEGS